MPLSAHCGLRAQLWFKGSGRVTFDVTAVFFFPFVFCFNSFIGSGTFFVNSSNAVFVFVCGQNVARDNPCFA